MVLETISSAGWSVSLLGAVVYGSLLGMVEAGEAMVAVGAIPGCNSGAQAEGTSQEAWRKAETEGYVPTWQQGAGGSA